MLNTIPLRKINNNEQHITEETIIEEGIRKIGEKTNEPFEENVLPKYIGGNIFAIPQKEQIMDNKLINDELQHFNLDVVNDKDIHIPNINDDKKIIISINKELSKISVFDENNKLLGFFTIQHMIKYLGNVYDTKQQFLTDLDQEVFKQSKILIKKLIFKLNYNKKNKYTDIIILDHTKSGFMGDVELLVKLNTLLDDYHKNKLQNDLAPIEPHNKVKIEQTVNKFVFFMINYTLKIISHISEMIKDDKTESKQLLKQQLLKYAIGLNYKLNIFVQEQLKFVHNQNKKIKESLDENLKIKTIIMERLDQGIKNIKSDKQSSPIKEKTKSLSASTYYEY